MLLNLKVGEILTLAPCDQLAKVLHHLERHDKAVDAVHEVSTFDGAQIEVSWSHGVKMEHVLEYSIVYSSVTSVYQLDTKRVLRLNLVPFVDLALFLGQSS